MKTTFTAEIYFHQCDPAGILFFAEVYKLAHNTYEQWLKSVECHALVFQNANLAFPIVSSRADFQSPIRQGEISMTIALIKAGNSSFELSYEARQNEKICAQINLSHVTIDRETQKPVTIPAELRRQFEA